MSRRKEREEKGELGFLTLLLNLDKLPVSNSVQKDPNSERGTSDKPERNK